MPLGCTICTEMLGNGVLTLGIAITKVRHRMGGFGTMIVIIGIDCCVAVRGSAILETAVLRFATTTMRTVGSSATEVFVSGVLWQGLLNHLPLQRAEIMSKAQEETRK